MRTICFCNSAIPWGGGEKWHLDAALSFARRGWRVLVPCHPKSVLHARIQAVLRDPAAVSLPPGSLKAVPLAVGRLTFLNPLVRAKLKRLFKEQQVHAVIMNLSSDLKLIARAARDAGVAHVAYRRGSALPVRDTALNRHLFGRVITRLIVNSEATRQLIPEGILRLMPENAVTVLPNGIDVAAFDRALEAADAVAEAGGRAALFLGPDAHAFFAPSGAGNPLVLGNAGRLNRQKGQHMLLLLGKRLLDRGTDFRLIIAGTGERLEELRRLSQELGLEGKVLFPGFMEDMGPFWRAIDVFVLTSLWEGFGFVLLEAMLARKPVLAFTVSNIPELVAHGVNGQLFPLPVEERANSPEPRLAEEADSFKGTVPYASLDAMADAVAELAGNPQQAEAMGLAGREFAEQRFSQEGRMDDLEALLEKTPG